jgi:hypothetical protein
VSCPARTRCTAVGATGFDSPRMLVEDLSGGRWHASVLSHRAVNPGTSGWTTSRAAPTVCSAVTRYISVANDTLTWAIASRGRTGGFRFQILPASAAFDNPRDLSCSAHGCTLVGGSAAATAGVASSTSDPRSPGAAPAPASCRKPPRRRRRPWAAADPAAADRRSWGFLIAGSGLVLWVLEGVSVAVDQPALAALVLVGWIVVQLLVLQRFFFLQPVIAVLGLTETGLAWLWQRNRGRRSDHTGTFVPDYQGLPAARVDLGSDVPADHGRGARAEGQR